MLIRRMAVYDVQGVAEIEQKSPSPWTSAQIADELASPGSMALVVEDDKKQLCGWCCARCCGDEAELLKISVRPDMRRRRYGDSLLESLQDQLARLGVLAIYLEVRSRNAPALALYQKHGFRRVGKRNGYYSNPTDDALIYTSQPFHGEGRRRQGDTKHETAQ